MFDDSSSSEETFVSKT
jgi:hypothetical protein